MKNIYIYLIISIFILSCSKDEFKDLKLGLNPYDSVEVTDAISIKNVNVSEYFLSSNGIDTHAVQFYFDYELNKDYFSDNDITKPKFIIRADLYVNNTRFFPRYDSVVKKFYVKEQFKHFKNKNNVMLYKISLYKDPENFNKVKIGSNQYIFRVN